MSKRAAASRRWLIAGCEHLTDLLQNRFGRGVQDDQVGRQRQVVLRKLMVGGGGYAASVFGDSSSRVEGRQSHHRELRSAERCIEALMGGIPSQLPSGRCAASIS